MSDTGCERMRELAPELALGIADGEDRAWALDHLAGCSACRARVESLSRVADELVLLAPEADPPAGFEARVAERVAPPGRRRPLRRRLAIPVAAAATAAALAAAIVWLALGDDRDLADSYRDTLAVANGEYFDAAPLAGPGDQRVGYVYGYQGRTSWVMVVVYDGVEAGRYEIEAVRAGGERLPLTELEVRDGSGSAGRALPVAYDELAGIRLLDDRGREVADSDVAE